MAIDKVKAYLRERGMEERVLEFDTSSATVELAAAAVGCEPARIAKTLSFHVGDRVALVVAAGDARIDNPKFKAQFGCKAKMLAADEAEPLIGHGVGGVCPFAVNDGVDVYLDESLRRFDVVYPAAGNAASAVRLTPDELQQCEMCIRDSIWAGRARVGVLGGAWGAHVGHGACGLRRPEVGELNCRAAAGAHLPLRCGRVGGAHGQP